MKHAESFNFKYMAVFRKTAEKARQYQTLEEAAELEQMLHRLDSVEDESEIPEQERDRIADRCDEIIRLSTNRLIMDTFPHDLETLMQDAESDLIELDPQRIKDVWLERRKQMFGKLLQQPEPDGLSKEEAEKLMDGDTFTRSVVARCMEPYVQAFLVFGYKLEMLEILIEKYDTAQPTEQTKPKKPRRIRIDSLPTQQLFPLDPVNYQLTEGLLSTGAAEPVNMFMKKKKIPGGKRVNAGQVQVFVTIDEDFVKYSQPLDDIDGSILRNIYTLVDAGEMRFNLSHIWAMTASDGKRLSKQKAQELIERIHRLMQTTVSIDCQAYAKAKGIDCPHIITGQILPGVYLDVVTNKSGEPIEANIKCALPVEEFPLLSFSRITNEITAIPLRAATVCGLTGDKVSALTNRRIIIREILLRRIFGHHNKPADQVVKFSRIYEKVSADSKIEKQRARDDANNLLLEWVEQGTIYAFSFRKVGKSFDAIVIAANKEEVKNFPGLGWYVKQ